MEGAEKFLGISLAAEKEMIYIVVHRDKRNDIMSAIMRDAGMASKAKSICFTLPVSATAGKRLSNLFILSAVSCVRGGPYP